MTLTNRRAITRASANLSRMSKLSESTWRELRTAHASGIGLRELARSMNIPAGTILARSKREGWTRHIRDSKALASPPAAPALLVATAAAASMAERGRRHLERMATISERTVEHVEVWQPGAVLDRIDELEKLDKIARRTFESPMERLARIGWC